MLFPSSIWINRKCTFFAHHKKRWFPTYDFNKDMFVTKTEQDSGDFSMDIFCPQRATPSTVATCWIFFTGRRLDLKNDLPIFVVIFCHSELHQYVWGNSQMPRNNALWKCLFFFYACSASDWFIVAIGDPKPTLTDRIMPIPNMHASEQEEDLQKKYLSKF